ncbi:hypothetical protein I5U62_14885 [Stenotrophomonas maltophilia]|nr:hypothetical protein [Stenotrophomonas maltophilia]
MNKASKILSQVEVTPTASNQHEINGVDALKKIFGLGKFTRQANFRHANGTSATVDVTWYDSRDAHPSRSEHRLYFQTNPVMDAANAGDTLTITDVPGQILEIEVSP